ncbi:MAG: tetratricopeptide repeat protein [Sedimentisphaerales bacterium]|nr:tetratricopeptide repeat protein [Sedimentisphaerales bacterium]
MQKTYNLFLLSNLWLFWLVCASVEATGEGNVFTVEPAQTLMPVQPEAQVIRTPAMDIQYAIRDVQPENLMRVELWYAQGYSGLWQLYDYDADRVGPIRFTAPDEGVYRLFIVAVDRWGRRSLPFEGGEQATGWASLPQNIPGQQVVFVDHTPPQLYLYSPPSSVACYSSRQLTLRWAGFDRFLAEKCVRFYYCTESEGKWVVLTESQPSSGEYLWQIPEKLTGPLQIMAEITDQAGHRTQVTSGKITITPEDQRVQIVKQQPIYNDDPTALVTSIVPTANLSTEGRIGNYDVADEMYRRGVLYRRREEWRDAARAFEGALSLRPDHVEARTNLANVYFRQGLYEKAQQQFELVLQQSPNRSTSLFGLAQTQLALEQKTQALATLERLVAVDDNDRQGWLWLGDVAQQLGQGQKARTAWKKALGSVPDDPIGRLARQRLESLP